MRRLAAAALLSAALLGARPTARPRDQQAFLDQGTFVITRGGDEIGREEFAISPVAGSRGEGGVLAVATVRYRDRELKAALELTRQHVPVSYQLDVTAAGRVEQRLTGQFGRGRFAVRIATPAHEAAREFPVPLAAVVLDDDIFDQYYFVPRASGAPEPVSVVRPRQSTLVTGAVTSLGQDTVLVGGRSIGAEHYALTLHGDDRREFWFSASGDLLKVAIPAGSIIATRLSLPSR
jgi:hypothetical protein